mmetsp:Transcript_33648/g.60405  ORF Transcript_33648/g.60405 Transcript_33648/m.60405 type:complete len:208 (+) Transcript_33648:183-806(+)
MDTSPFPGSKQSGIKIWATSASFFSSEGVTDSTFSSAVACSFCQSCSKLSISRCKRGSCSELPALSDSELSLTSCSRSFRSFSPARPRSSKPSGHQGGRDDGGGSHGGNGCWSLSGNGASTSSCSCCSRARVSSRSWRQASSVFSRSWPKASMDNSPFADSTPAAIKILATAASLSNRDGVMEAASSPATNCASFQRLRRPSRSQTV